MSAAIRRIQRRARPKPHDYRGRWVQRRPDGTTCTVTPITKRHRVARRRAKLAAASRKANR